jgi:RNA polymerase sigma factor (sigma-70 family)
MGETSDDLLWRRVARDDRDAFAELFNRHARRVYGLCFRQTGDWDLAQDLTSITFLEAWRRRRSVLVDEGKVPAWLLGIAYNSLRHQWRSRRRYSRALAQLAAQPVEPDHADDSAARASAEREAVVLLRQLGRLSKPQRAVLSLVGWEGLSPAEAAHALGMPEATVRSHLHRARRRLQPPTEPSPPPTPAASISIDERIGSS